MLQQFSHTDKHLWDLLIVDLRLWLEQTRESRSNRQWRYVHPKPRFTKGKPTNQGLRCLQWRPEVTTAEQRIDQRLNRNSWLLLIGHLLLCLLCYWFEGQCAPQMQICGKSQRTGEETQTSLRGFKPMTFPVWGDSANQCYAGLWSILRLIKLKHKAAKDTVVSVQKINVIHSCSSLAMLKLLVFTSKCWLKTFSDPPGRLEQLESRMEQTKARQSSFQRIHLLAPSCRLSSESYTFWI